MLAGLMFAAADSRPAPWDDFWYGDVRPMPAAGIRPNADRVLQLTPVAACLRAIAETMAALPIHVFRERIDGTAQRDKDHPLNDLLRLHPNALMTSSEYVDFMTRGAALRGNSYSRIVASPGMVHRLIPMPTDTVKARVNGFSIDYEVKHKDGGSEILSADQVLHLRAGDLTRSALLAEDPIVANSDTFAAAIAAQDYAARYFANDATPRGVVEVDGMFKDETKLEDFKRKLKSALSFRSQHSNLVLTGGAKYKQVGSTNKESQMLELRRFYVVELCRIFGVPPHIAKDLQDATYSNIEQQALEFVKQTIMPWVTRWEQLIKARLVSPSEPDVFVKFNLDALLRGDITSRYAAFASAINTGWMVRNEARELEDMNPLPGLDEPIMQGAMTSNPRQADDNQGGSGADDADEEVADEARALRASWVERKPGAFKAWTRDYYDELCQHMQRAHPPAVAEAYTRAAYGLINESDDISTLLHTWESRQAPVLAKLLEANR